MLSKSVAIGVGLLLALGGGTAWVVSKKTVDRSVSEADLAKVPPLDPELATFFPLDPQAKPTAYDTTAEGREVELRRAFKGWEVVAGHPHLRLETHAGRHLVATAWLRPATTAEGLAQLLCSRRQVGSSDYALLPPQPILQGPLEVGSTWSWSGHVGPDPCRAEFKVLRRETRDGLEILEIEQITTLEGPGRLLVSRRTQTFAAGRGLISEQGTTAAHQPTRRVEIEVRATAREPSED